MKRTGHEALSELALQQAAEIERLTAEAKHWEEASRYWNRLWRQHGEDWYTERKQSEARIIELENALSGRTLAYPPGWEEAVKVVEAARDLKQAATIAEEGSPMYVDAVDTVCEALAAYDRAVTAAQADEAADGAGSSGGEVL